MVRSLMMQMANNSRVCIGNTFRDLQEEQEHLVNKVFLEIHAIYRQRGIIFTDIDAI